MFSLLGSLAGIAIKTHVVASMLHNTPDSFNQDLHPYVGGWPIPGWRFFAPNPGVQNVHLLIRTGDGSGSLDGSGLWEDVTPPITHNVMNIIWNPGSRGPKALFDFMQQLTMMNSNYAEFDWIRQSMAYELVASTARGFIQDTHASSFQFLLMNYYPSAPTHERMSPIMVSEWLSRTEESES